MINAGFYQLVTLARIAVAGRSTTESLEGYVSKMDHDSKLLGLAIIGLRFPTKKEQEVLEQVYLVAES